MANEITVTSRLIATKSNFKHQGVPRSKQVTMNGTLGVTVGFTATTTATALTIPTVIGTPGWCELTNLDAAIDIYLDGNSGANFKNSVMVKPGETAQFRTGLAANAVYVKSASGTPKGTITILED